MENGKSFEITKTQVSEKDLLDCASEIVGLMFGLTARDACIMDMEDAIVECMKEDFAIKEAK